ncbi:MAG: prepilin peptidase [Desulfosarcinaceae bacterium]|nr:prepilin peptidase [Desulfosarcinaceae bacterium]
MFSAGIATATGAMRPGIVTGRYPERDDRIDARMARCSAVLKGLLKGSAIHRQRGLRRIAARINQEGAALAALTTAQLDARVVALRRRFRAEGLTTPLCVQAFALIRELSARTLAKRHYDVQLMGGWVILQGRLAEMETGEGKTLTATLAAATAALAGIPVHVLTVNEYLVTRDAKAMRPLYEALGLTVGAVTQEMSSEQCCAAYACDITYSTNKQVAFDYLRDRLLQGRHRSQLRLEMARAGDRGKHLQQCRLRGLCFAIVDEADSVLIDEARTPLILTRSVDSAAEDTRYRQALRIARTLVPGADFYLDLDRRQALLFREGQQRLAQLLPDESPFWRNPRRRETLVRQALHALYLLERDRDYLVQEERVLIIDANTGRTMPDRSWESGLHQLVEIKEGCPLTAAREQLGRLTYQRFFRRYLRLGGMSGTAREVSGELGAVYNLRVQRIPLHRPSRRRELPTRVLRSAQEKWAAVVDAVAAMKERGRPVLVGTASVADSERLSHLLGEAGIDHQVLNARQDQAEARIVAAAGDRGQVTVATNMAGRGTDIPLGEGVAELGGLHVIAACRNDAGRIDRQLFGRCARQGDPGSHEVLLSLEDDLLKPFATTTLLALLRWLSARRAQVPQMASRRLFRWVQRRCETHHRAARRALLRHERHIGEQLAFSGPME